MEKYRILYRYPHEYDISHRLMYETTSYGFSVQDVKERFIVKYPYAKPIWIIFYSSMQKNVYLYKC